MFTVLETKLYTLNKNVLYITNQVDFIRRKIIQLDTDKALQKQVTDYYGDDSEHFPEPPLDKEPD